MKKTLEISGIFFACFLFSFGVLAEDSGSPDANISERDAGNIEISAAVSKIRWEGDIIRSWDASGDVEITYSRGNRILHCRADKAFFTREGTSESFKDNISLNGNIAGNVNGIQIEASELNLENVGESYCIETQKKTELSGENYSISTNHLVLDASGGNGQFPEGAAFEFNIESDKNKFKTLETGSDESSFFGQCLRIDTTGGVINAPYIEIQYSFSDDKFRLTRVMLPSGAELHPVNQSTEDEGLVFDFGKAEIDFEIPGLTASDKVLISNGPCRISCERMGIQWGDRKIQLDGNVVLERESVKFETGMIELRLDDAGRISLSATGSPKMTIVVPEEKTEGILKNQD